MNTGPLASCFTVSQCQRNANVGTAYFQSSGVWPIPDCPVANSCASSIPRLNICLERNILRRVVGLPKNSVRNRSVRILAYRKISKSESCLSCSFSCQRRCHVPVVLSVLVLSVEITDICRLFNSNVDYFFKLSIKTVDYFIHENKENSLLNLPGSRLSSILRQKVKQYIQVSRVKDARQCISQFVTMLGH